MEVGIGGRGRPPRVRETVDLIGAGAAGLRRWGGEVGDFSARKVRATARRRRRVRGSRPSGPWPIGNDRRFGVHSYLRFSANSETVRGGEVVNILNSAAYAKALEKGARPNRSGWRRPKGDYIHRIWIKSIRREAGGLLDKFMVRALSGNGCAFRRLTNA